MDVLSIRDRARKIFKITTGGVTCGIVCKNLVVPDVRSVMGRKAIRYQGPCKWILLSNDLKVIENHSKFCQLLQNR